ncbi:hypothetical protein HYN59_16330 [Flavobacterium album]|uniref:2'-5' RNA ligase n=1 Tax=Flavobacterium album TaxID=2175091 RepID=A0A2S1R1T5_9FLAO|nr:2'-5' RNA ligase family protein [Flavobacterium album]AWH86577.1 hypothetical protein HYN59_16330 [Flavobacterium album]
MGSKRIYNQAALFGPLYAYLVVLSPPPGVIDAIAAIKQEMNSIVDIGERNLHSKAHITLFDRLTDDAGLAETVKTLISTDAAFNVTIAGWGTFDHGHSVTVYLKIANPERIVALAEKLKSKASTPHISLAKKLPYATFEKLQPFLQNLNFTAVWKCDEVLVLRKLMSEKHLGFKESFYIPLRTQ